MALAEQTKTLVTAEELLHLSAGDKKYELIEGDGSSIPGSKW